jgi:hypothetical protein
MTSRAHRRTEDLLKKDDFKSTGFVARMRTPVRRLEHFFVAVSYGLIGFTCLYYFNALTGVYLMLGAACFMGMSSVHLERGKSVQQSTEFLNAVFASAMGRGYRFCMVAGFDGHIIYVNAPFQDLFPTFMAQPERTLDSWSRSQAIANVALKELMVYVSDGSDGRVPLTMRLGEEPNDQSVLLFVETVEQIQGYVIIRGL